MYVPTPSNKPHFETWNITVLVELAHDLWDDNMMLRDAVEQLRLDLRSAMALSRKQYDKDDWK